MKRNGTCIRALPDYYTRLAARDFGVPVNEVTQRQRHLTQIWETAKLYGATDYGRITGLPTGLIVTGGAR